MAYRHFKDLNRRTDSDRILRNKAFIIAKKSKYDGYERALTSMVYNIFDKQNFCLENTVNPTYLIRCCNWTPAQPYPEGKFYVLYQYSINPTIWDVANVGTAYCNLLCIRSESLNNPFLG